MVPPVGGRVGGRGGVSPLASTDTVLMAQHQVVAAKMTECVKQEVDEEDGIEDGQIKEVEVETVVKTECVQQDGDNEDLEVSSVECLNMKCQVTIRELKKKLEKSNRLMKKHEKMLQLEQEQHVSNVRLLNEKMKLMEENEELLQDSSE
jgi:hypothetical protein